METTLKASASYMEFVMDFYKRMKEYDISLVYEGEITQEITLAFTSMAERNMTLIDEDGSVKKKVYHVMVECLQNICKHADMKDSHDPSISSKTGMFIVGKNVDEYFVTSGNLVTNDKIEWMKEILNKINSLDQEGIKQLFKETLKNGSISDKGGAGLGFIDIAKKTGNKLEYHFQHIDDQHSFFLLKSKVTRKI
ncbi:MAG: hypothetical protein A3K10_11355 [Bacteroidetes bacterium RIFCSPLOWO2_12_FULL_31_6]|nr:MAG: hypothetical protein A3K10_11355 [Bacteroidetes bacterium RIFCSPLOWO2_12_FULL_31_6]